MSGDLFRGGRYGCTTGDFNDVDFREGFVLVFNVLKHVIVFSCVLGLLDCRNLSALINWAAFSDVASSGAVRNFGSFRKLFNLLERFKLDLLACVVVCDESADHIPLSLFLTSIACRAGAELGGGRTTGGTC